MNAGDIMTTSNLKNLFLELSKLNSLLTGEKPNSLSNHEQIVLKKAEKDIKPCLAAINKELKTYLPEDLELPKLKIYNTSTKIKYSCNSKTSKCLTASNIEYKDVTEFVLLREYHQSPISITAYSPFQAYIKHLILRKNFSYFQQKDLENLNSVESWEAGEQGAMTDIEEYSSLKWRAYPILWEKLLNHPVIKKSPYLNTLDICTERFIKNETGYRIKSRINTKAEKLFAYGKTLEAINDLLKLADWIKMNPGGELKTYQGEVNTNVSNKKMKTESPEMALLLFKMRIMLDGKNSDNLDITIEEIIKQDISKGLKILNN